MIDGITVLSNKLGLYISRAIYLFILISEIKVIITASDIHRMIIIAMYGYIIDIYQKPKSSVVWVGET